MGGNEGRGGKREDEDLGEHVEIDWRAEDDSIVLMKWEEIKGTLKTELGHRGKGTSQSAKDRKRLVVEGVERRAGEDE